jgi:O-antigen ligase
MATETWRLIKADQRAARLALAERWIIMLSGAVLIAMLLYVMIGNKPYVHVVALDPLTGATEMSPINRYIWLALGAMSVPLLWWRRADLPAAAVKLWPLILLMLWFAATTRWAIDGPASSRRLLLVAINLVICIAVATGLKDARRIHAAMAFACAIVVGIDLGSWILIPGRSMTDLGLAAIHSHKNTLGAVMLLAGMVCSTYAWGRPTLRGQVFWWAVTAAAVALLLASQSKTSIGIFAGVAAFIPVLMFVLRQRPIFIASVVAVGTATVLAGVFLWLAINYATGGDPIDPFRGITFTQRRDVWQFVWHEFTLRPFKGVGFGSFWDVNPRVQPSLQTDYWFSTPDAFTNEAHNGYLDILATTGLFGLAGALFLLLRWMGRAVGDLRSAIFTGDRQALAAAAFLGVFPLLFFGHNFLESSYFTANAFFGSIILLVGVTLDLKPRPRISSASPPAAMPWRSVPGPGPGPPR